MDKNILPPWLILLWILVVMGLLSGWARAGSECDPVLCSTPQFAFQNEKVWHGLNLEALLSSMMRAGTGNLNKPLSGESATFDCPTGRENGAEDGKKNETDALSGVQSKSGVSGLGGRQDAGRTGAAV